MKRFVLIISLLTLFLNNTVSSLADLQKGFNAAQRGDFVTALSEWTRLAEQGDDFAQFNIGVMYELENNDTQLAIEFYKRSAALGLHRASKNYEYLIEKN